MLKTSPLLFTALEFAMLFAELEFAMLFTELEFAMRFREPFYNVDVDARERLTAPATSILREFKARKE